MLTYLFPGQGFQAVGMGKELFDDFAGLTDRADAILGYSVRELCLEDPRDRLNLTRYAQPAIYVVNSLAYLRKIGQSNQKPDFVAGHSLGEYNALFAAGAFDFEVGLRLVAKRGALMGRARGGTMAAVLNVSQREIEAVLGENGLGSIDIANYNAPSQIVISGPEAQIEQAAKPFKAAGAVYLPLPVSGAFHSRYMEAAQQEFGQYLETFRFNSMEIPVISNVTARPYSQADIRHHLSKQITHPVKWTESIQYLLGKGEMAFEPVGPGKSLMNMVKSIRKETRIPPADSPGGTGPAGQAGAAAFNAESLGSAAFKKAFNLKYAYVAGGMVKGIASEEMVIKMAKSGFLSYFGTGGLDLARIEQAVDTIQRALDNGTSFGMNLLANIRRPEREADTVDLFLRCGVRNIEASAYMQLTPPLVKFRLKGLTRDPNGRISPVNRILAKVSRPEVAELFFSPAPQHMVDRLLAAGEISSGEAGLSRLLPMADFLCVEADSGGHTDRRNLNILLPTIRRLGNRIQRRHGYRQQVPVGAAGGIGTPEAAVAAFVQGAAFILTGSINQCTVEAATSEAAKDILQTVNIQDTDYAPAGDMFELGAKVQVVKKGLFFPARANKLFDIYQRYGDWNDVDEKTRKQIEDHYFSRSFEAVYEAVRQHYGNGGSKEIVKAEENPRHKMALVFRWYFYHTMGLALEGREAQRINYQIHCGPALGAFNQWIRGTRLESWRNRNVDTIGEMIMEETAALLNQNLAELPGKAPALTVH